MRILHASLLLALALVTGSCVTRRNPPSAEELASADYGLVPIEYERRVQRFVRAEYRDLQVVEVEVGEPRKGWYGNLGGIVIPRDIRFGWVVRFRGYRLGFTGMKPVVAGDVFFRNDVLEGIADARDGFRFVDQNTRW